MLFTTCSEKRKIINQLLLSEEEWQTRCNHAKGFEHFFMEKEPALDLVVDEIIINTQDDRESDYEDGDDDENSISVSEDSESDLSRIEPL